MGMYRITLAKMLVLLRLVIIASLAGYSLPAASAAMHGAIATSTTVQSDDHHEMTNGDHVHGDESASPDDMQKIAKQECCKDFCVSFAIFATADVVGGPVVMASIREFINDNRVVGELVPLHRPPNI
ncbi:hypothetical protein LJR255_003418 [Pararhizobium sp. LjRoot255]|uniref:hypothetical protein n=1 Tax=Pararhizobium sp. LjRoot255 TaxID=3342298 RepID=UPI003ECFA6B1